MKFAVHTLGCKVNTYESEYIISKMQEKGYILTSFDDFADIYIINTCTVTNTSDVKSRKMIRQAKKKNKDSVVAVMGCYTQIKDNNDSILDYADVIIGNTNKSKLVDLIEEHIKTKEKIIRTEDVMNATFDNMQLVNFETRTRALVKIQDGCNNYCTYCIIPFVRGNVRSKRPELVLDEVKALVENGYKEIVLTGIHTGHYGSDLDNYDFSDLLTDLEKIKGLERIRISSIEIVELNDKFLNVLSNSKKIVNHIHIPLQAGSNHILKLMNRRYDKKYFFDKINNIRKIRPDIAITTDVIVGFPGETKEDFEETLEFVEKLNFAGGHVFPYSIRNGTPAAKMKGQLTKEEKHVRVKKLIEKFNELEEHYSKKFLNERVIIIPEVYENGYLIGHTDNYLKVMVKGSCDNIGEDLEVKLINYDDKVFIGEI